MGAVTATRADAMSVQLPRTVDHFAFLNTTSPSSKETNMNGSVAKAMIAPRVRRIAELQRLVKAAGSDQHPQGGAAYELAREQMRKAELEDQLSRLGLVPQSQSSAIAGASAPAISRAQGAPVNSTTSARGQLVAVRDGTYAPQTLPREETQLDSQTRIQALRKELEEAMSGKDMQRASALSYQLSKAELVQMHRQGDRRTVRRGVS